MLGVLWGLVAGEVRAQEETGFEGKVLDGVGLIAEVYRLILENYAVELDPMELAEAAVRGMTGRLDDYTSYISPEENRELYGANSRIGPGLDVAFIDGGWRITTLIPGSSAETTGLRPGDRLRSIDGTAVDSLRGADIYRLLDGDERKGVEIVVTRGAADSTLTFRPRRERIERPSLGGTLLLPDSILYVDIDRFADYVGVTFRSELLRIGRYEGPPERVRGIILDLRGNTGGKLREGTTIADMLLPSGSGIVSLDSRNERDRMEEASREREILPDIPLVVLVDRRTASTAEVLAAALQENRRGTILGEGSYGKGLVQSVERLSNGGFLHVTSAWYRTPTGRSTQGPERYPVVPDSLRGTIGVAPTAISGEPEESTIERLDLLWRLDTAHLFTLFANDVAAAHERLTPALLTDPTLYDRFRAIALQRDPATRSLLTGLDSLRLLSGITEESTPWRTLRQEVVRQRTDLFDRHREQILSRIRQEIIRQFPTTPDHLHLLLQHDPLITTARRSFR